MPSVARRVGKRIPSIEVVKSGMSKPNTRPTHRPDLLLADFPARPPALRAGGHPPLTGRDKINASYSAAANFPRALRSRQPISMSVGMMSPKVR